MIGSEDLYSRTDLGRFPDGDLRNIKDHAVEIQEHAGTEVDIETIIAMERRADYGTFADGAQAFQQKPALL